MVKVTRTIAEIDNDIAITTEALKNVRGTETEVYARIVGYYRSVRNWNKGKRDEYNHRKQFVLGKEILSVPSVPVTMPNSSQEKSAVSPSVADLSTELREEIPMSTTISGTYEFFSRGTCPNCPPVKKHLANTKISGKNIDVDTDEGLARAADMGVFAAPTVILFREDGTEIGRAHTVSELSELLMQKAEYVA